MGPRLLFQVYKRPIIPGGAQGRCLGAHGNLNCNLTRWLWTTGWRTARTWEVNDGSVVGGACKKGQGTEGPDSEPMVGDRRNETWGRNCRGWVGQVLQGHGRGLSFIQYERPWKATRGSQQASRNSGSGSIRVGGKQIWQGPGWVWGLREGAVRSQVRGSGWEVSV